MFLATGASAHNWYLAQVSSGAGTGADAADALPIGWINSPGNWGSGPNVVSPGDTVHLTGTITSSLTAFASGVQGNPITIYFEPNARMSQPASGLINISNQSYIVIDGGTNGILENTDNGTALDYHVSTNGIYACSVSNIEIKNLSIQNLYVHTSPADSAIDFTSAGGIYMNGFGSNISIHDCTFHDICWCLTLSGSPGASGLNIYNNTFYNYDHAVAGIGGNLASPANVDIHNNTFGSTANWDTTANVYHHDGIHIYFGTGGLISGVNIYGNLFQGDQGNNNTAHIFLEGDWSHGNPESISNIALWNNVFLQYPGNYLNDGFLAGAGGNASLYNNTFVGSGITNSSAVTMSGSGLSIKNNLISGVTTFLSIGGSSTFAAGGLNNNLYAAATPGGNAPFSFLNTSYNTLSAWQAATNGDSNSSVVIGAQIESNGQLELGSAAIGAGANLSPYFNTDKNGSIRNAPWDIGAFDAPLPPPVENVRVRWSWTR